MQRDKVQNYNEHAKFLADLALSILKGNTSVMDINGAKEIIALYLLIPYMTDQRLTTPGVGYVIPRLRGSFIGNITYDDLRNTICHSFVTVEEDRGDGIHGKHLIFDDRIITEKKEHSKKDHHSEAFFISVEAVHDILMTRLNEIVK